MYDEKCTKDTIKDVQNTYMYQKIKRCTANKRYKSVRKKMYRKDVRKVNEPATKDVPAKMQKKKNQV